MTNFKGIILFPKKTQLLPLHTNVDNVQQVRLVPSSNYYKIEVVYDKPEQQLVPKNEEYLSIDLGIKNLMIFPELENHFELFETCRGLNITFGVSSKKAEDALLLYSAFQIPTCI
jgi:transposase